MEPTTFQGISSGKAISTRHTETHGPLRGMARATMRPSGIWIARMMPVKISWRSSAAWKRSECSTSSNQPHAGPEELVVAESLLHRIVHHRHQRDDGIERDQHHHRQDEEPGFLVDGLVHDVRSPSSRLHRPGYGRDRTADARCRPESRAPSGTSSLMTRLGMARLDDAIAAGIGDLGDLHGNARGRETHELRPHAELELLAVAAIGRRIHGLDRQAGRTWPCRCPH